MLRNLILLIVAFSLSNGMISAQPSKDLETIRQRIVNKILSYTVGEKSTDKLLSTLNADGSWEAINYIDTSRTGFQHLDHVINLVSLAKAYQTPKSNFFKSDRVKQAIVKGLGFWVQKDFIGENWWHNQIGVPDNLANLMLLIGDALPRDLVNKTQPIIMRGNLNASGARPSGDRIKIGDISARQYLFLKDEEAFNKIVKIIEEEIKFETGKGMQYDYSFHHREDRANNTLTYGLQFANVFAYWADYVKGTRFAFSQEKVKTLVDYYIDGICKMMIFGKYPDVAASNRDLTRRGELEAMDAETVEKLLAVTNYRSQELRDVLNVRTKNAKTKLSHSKFFWLSEYFSQQRPNYFASVRMYSTRNTNTEHPYNGEGLLNHHIGDGANYIYTRGDEYYDIFPVWDWQKVPGTTALQKDSLVSEKKVQLKGVTSFVGGITDGRNGAAAMDFVSPLDSTKAKKAWFFFDDFYVCLGTGISSEQPGLVVTTINQALSKGPVTLQKSIRDGNFKENQLISEDTSANNLAWVYHDNVGYHFPIEQNIFLSNKSQSGSWYKINRQITTSKAEVKKPVFKLWIDNGKRPKDNRYSYAVFPSVSLTDFKKKTDAIPYDILDNNVNVQAVRNRTGKIVQAVFYKPAKIRATRDVQLQMHTPGMILFRFDGKNITQVHVSDPGRNLKEISFSLAPINSASTTGKEKIYKVKMPTDSYAGKSIQVKIMN